MRLKKMHWLGLGSGLALIALSLLFFMDKSNLLLFLIGIGITIIALPFVVGLVVENKREQEINDMFLEFSRNLAESVSTGTPISKSIINARKNNYGALSPYIEKLANQISLGIPMNKALRTFAYDVDSAVISRAVALISEAERAGGEIDYILESVAKSISEVEKLKQERKAVISNLVVQGYIIFFIFIGIMLIMEYKILPLTQGVGGSSGLGGIDVTKLAEATNVNSEFSPEKLSEPFLYLLLAQGLFAGLTIGKLSEGNLKAGIKHSFILILAAFLISSGVRAFFG